MVNSWQALSGAHKPGRKDKETARIYKQLNLLFNLLLGYTEFFWNTLGIFLTVRFSSDRKCFYPGCYDCVC